MSSSEATISVLTNSAMTVRTNKEMPSSRTGKPHSITTTDQLTLFEDVIRSNLVHGTDI